MNRRISVIAVLSLGVFLLPAVQPLQSESQGWMSHSLSYQAGTRLTLSLSNEMRFEKPAFSDRYLYNWLGMIAYRISGGFYAAAGYQLEKTKTLQFTLEENRIVFDVGWRKQIAKKLELGIRLRIESRKFDDDLAEDQMRFRLKVRLSTQLRPGSFTVRPFAAIEPFGDDKDKEINRYRFYAGIIFPVSGNLGILVGYIRQATKNRETLHILNTGLKLSF